MRLPTVKSSCAGHTCTTTDARGRRPRGTRAVVGWRHTAPLGAGTLATLVAEDDSAPEIVHYNVTTRRLEESLLSWQ